MFYRKYATATHIYLPIVKRGVVDYAVSADWTPAAGDVKISIDGAAAANVTNLPTAITMGNTAQWDFSLTTGEMTGKKVTITVADSATKAVEDQCFEIETYGHASAEYQADFSAANLPANLVQILATTLTETSGGLLAAAFKKFFDKASPTGTINSLPDVVAGNANGLALVGSAMTLSAAAVQAIWDALTSALTTVGSIGKLFVDKLGGVSGQVAGQSEVLAIQNNTRVRVVVPAAIERPDSGSMTYRLWLYLYDEVGNMEAPDSLPTITAQNNSGTDRSSGLSSVTNDATGVYHVDYTVAAAHAIEALLFEWSVVEGGATRKHGGQVLVVDTTAVDFTSSDRTLLQGIASNTDVATSTRLGAGAYTAPPTVDQIGDEIESRSLTLSSDERANVSTTVWTFLGEGAESVLETLRLCRAMLVGRSSGFPSGPYSFRDKANTKDRVSIVADADGNRSSVTTDGT